LKLPLHFSIFQKVETSLLFVIHESGFNRPGLEIILMSLEKRIKAKAASIGFDLVGIAPVSPVPELSFYVDWIEAGHAGKMEYLKRNVDKRQDVTLIVPEARSVIVCALIYHTDNSLSIDCDSDLHGWISRYGWGDDYHDVFLKMLFDLNEFISAGSTGDYISRVYVDTGPVVDRVHAKYAGIGWYGKNTCIINQQAGSWFFLGEIITNMALQPDVPVPDRCGTCQRCIDECPTDAILEPYVLDSRKCISYLTIELKDDIPVALRDQMGNHLFGCDICQDVCPWNRKAQSTGNSSFQPREGLVNPQLDELAEMDDEAFRKKFRKSPLKRSKQRGLLRNLAVAMGNSKNPVFLEILKKMSAGEDSMVARHAEWAIKKIKKN
jgi:epoxyqueuosine reductase